MSVLPKVSAAIIALLCMGAQPAAGQEDFYRGKQITFLIGLGAGETYDIYARLLARYMPKYIPGEPLIVPSNRPGAGSLNAVNSLFNTAARDGTVIGTGHRFVPLMPLLQMPGTQFDGLKLNYIGSMAREVGVCIARKDTGFRSMEDTKSREFMVGTTGAGAEMTTFNATMTKMLGAQLKVIRGYLTSTDIDLALERGELQGRCGVSYGSLRVNKPEWLQKDYVTILIQLGLTKHPDLPNVPLLTDLVKDPEDKAALELMLAPSNMARPFFAPPDVPAERIAILRKAFDAAMKDPALIEEAAKLRLEISPMTGQEIEALMKRLHALPQPVLERARALANTKS